MKIKEKKGSRLEIWSTFITKPAIDRRIKTKSKVQTNDCPEILRKLKNKKKKKIKNKKNSFAWIRACVHFRNVSRVVCTLNDVERVYCAVQSVDCAWIEDSLAPCWTIEISKENGCRYNRGYNRATDCSSLSLVFLETFCARTKSNYAKI